MPYDPLGPGGRKHRRLRKLGAGARCLFCGIEELVVLSAQRVPIRLIEEHHVVGRAHDEYLTVPLCRNCHAVTSARQLDDDVELKKASNVIDWILALLDGLASFFRMLWERAKAWLTKALAFKEGLDRDYPGWSQQLWAGI